MRLLVWLAVMLTPIAAFAVIKYNKIQIVTAGSMGASLNSTPVDITNYDNVNIQAVWTGITGSSGSGTFKLQASNDLAGCASVTTWTDQSGTSQAISADGDFMWNLIGQGYRCIRLVYTRAAGTGTLNVVLSGKGL